VALVPVFGSEVEEVGAIAKHVINRDQHLVCIAICAPPVTADCFNSPR
jgi:hypothetical protein